MITLRKLRSLSPGTRLRKSVRLLQGAEAELREARLPDSRYFAGLLEFLLGEIEAGTVEAVGLDRVDGAPAGGPVERIEALRGEARRLLGMVTDGGSRESLLRGFNTVRHLLGGVLGTEPGEWDLSPRAASGSAASIGGRSTGSLPGPAEAGAPELSNPLQLFEIALYLEDVRSPFNLGSIARSGEAFGAAGVLLSPAVPSVDHPRARRSAMGAFDRLPTGRAALPGASPSSLGGASESRPGEGRRPQAGGVDRAPLELPPETGDFPNRGPLPVFALETGGTPIENFRFPSRGICLLGSEELGLSPEALALADRSFGRCTIPLYGGKGSLNVGVAAGILLAYWTSTLDGEEKKGPAGDRRSLFSSIVNDWGEL